MATQCFYTKCANKTQTGQGHNVMTYSKHVQFKYNCNTECDSTQNKNMLNHFYWCTICSNKPMNLKPLSYMCNHICILQKKTQTWFQRQIIVH